MRRIALVLLGLTGLTCGSSETTAPTTTPSVGGAAGFGGNGGGGGAPPDCNTALGTLPDNLVEIAYDGAPPYTNLSEKTWTIDTGVQQYVLTDQVLNEAVRFELAHPARIHGFRLQWAALPADGDPNLPLEAGLYPDFGYNGFDFWPEAYGAGAASGTPSTASGSPTCCRRRSSFPIPVWSTSPTAMPGRVRRSGLSTRSRPATARARCSTTANRP
jgi:hypothetical protein